MFKIDYKIILLIVLYAVLNTLLSLSILYIVNANFTNEVFLQQKYTGLFFFAAVFSSYYLNIFFQKWLVKFIYGFVYDSEIKLIKKLLDISLIQLEDLGTERINGIIEDLRLFIYLPGILTNMLNSVLMVTLCTCYLFTISSTGALIALSLIILITTIYFLVSKRISKKMMLLRDYNDVFYKIFKDVLYGFKELKVSLTKRRILFNDHIKRNRNDAQDLDTFLSNKLLAVNILSQYGLYLVFGVILFLLPLLGYMHGNQMKSFIVVLLFISSPVNRLISMQSFYTRASVAWKRVSDFFLEIDPLVQNRDDGIMPPLNQFDGLEFRNCVWRYGNSFVMGPINLKIKKGEVIFITGGNGSGKSTFVKLLTGLYQPSSGEILLNDIPVDTSDYRYQDLLSVIFTDNYLFSKNFDNYTLKGNKRYNELLISMELDNIVRDDNELSIRRQFSKGQSKRVSMIFALLENNPILVLDEWAADQDPYFRKKFYTGLIPELKAKEKTIIAVTHDDSYFYLCDRILRFEDGQLVYDVNSKDELTNYTNLWSK